MEQPDIKPGDAHNTPYAAASLATPHPAATTTVLPVGPTDSVGVAVKRAPVDCGTSDERCNVSADGPAGVTEQAAGESADLDARQGDIQTAHSTSSSSSSSSSQHGEEEDSEDEGSNTSGEEDPTAVLLNRLACVLALTHPTETVRAQDPVPPHAPAKLRSLNIAGIAHLISTGQARRIVCMVGAGISVSAGIPDFRTPGTGLYSQLEAYNLPRPEAVFDITYFRRNPEPFHRLARALFPGNHQPTPTHHFIHLLHKKGLLLRCFTQNIDSLETQAGLPADKLVAAHGNFDSAACIECEHSHPTTWVRDTILAGDICRCKHCGGLVKPNIVFFGEALPDVFDRRRRTDLPACDLLIVMGTSLVVMPFASLLYDVGPKCPRLLINREVVGTAGKWDMLMGGQSPGFQFLDPQVNKRDALWLGNCDDGVRELATLCGWSQDLQELMDASQAARSAVSDVV